MEKQQHFDLEKKERRKQVRVRSNREEGQGCGGERGGERGRRRQDTRAEKQRGAGG